MFEEAPSEVFLPQRPPLDPLNDFYIESSPISSAEEDLAHVTEVSVRLADFGTGDQSGLLMKFCPIDWFCSKLDYISSSGMDTTSNAARP
jgi:hypothetical protein